MSDDIEDSTAEATSQGPWAVYDLTLERFVGGVHRDKKPTKKAAEALAGQGHTVEVRDLT